MSAMGQSEYQALIRSVQGIKRQVGELAGESKAIHEQMKKDSRANLDMSQISSAGMLAADPSNESKLETLKIQIQQQLNDLRNIIINDFNQNYNTHGLATASLAVGELAKMLRTEPASQEILEFSYALRDQCLNSISANKLSKDELLKEFKINFGYLSDQYESFKAMEIDEDVDEDENTAKVATASGIANEDLTKTTMALTDKQINVLTDEEKKFLENPKLLKTLNNKDLKILAKKSTNETWTDAESSEAENLATRMRNQLNLSSLAKDKAKKNETEKEQAKLLNIKQVASEEAVRKALKTAESSLVSCATEVDLKKVNAGLDELIRNPPHEIKDSNESKSAAAGVVSSAETSQPPLKGLSSGRRRSSLAMLTGFGNIRRRSTLATIPEQPLTAQSIKDNLAKFVSTYATILSDRAKPSAMEKSLSALEQSLDNFSKKYESDKNIPAKLENLQILVDNLRKDYPKPKPRFSLI